MKSRNPFTPARRNVPIAGATRAPIGRKSRRRYALKLYVAGADHRSASAIRAVVRFCEGHLEGRCQLAIIDVHQQPELALADRIVAVPTLIRERPLPLRRLIGSLTGLNTLLVGVDRRPRS